jgi:ABC-2 type transport system ATP-binding protein
VIVEAEALVVKFRRGLLRRRFAALDGLDLQVREGDFFALLGPNGAGKSTAMHCMLGVLRPTAGRVRVLERTPEPGSSLFAEIGYLPEDPRYHDYLSVEEAVLYYASLSGVRFPAARVASVLERLGLAEHRRLAIRRCSKGMKQKVGIAQCLVHEPRLLFLDEPMRGLDPMTVRLFRDILIELNRTGATIVMNSHLLGEVEMVANRVAIIDRGRLIVQDDVARLVQRGSDCYAVEVDGEAETPPQLADAVRSNGHVRGTLPADALYPFMDYARAHGLRVVSCALKTATLEERFMAILGKGRPNA